MRITTLLVIAKAPVAGRVKTRLCPPCTPAEAARVAEAALVDTLETVRTLDGVRPLLVLDGERGDWLPDGLAVIPQRGTCLGSRLASAFCDADGPALLIGMDTPHVDATVLADAVDALHRPGVDAVIGDTFDGGWWAAGFHDAPVDIFDGVPMSTAHTARAQRSRMRSLGINVADLPLQRDVDTFDDAIVAAATRPESRFARTVTCVRERIGAVASAPDVIVTSA